MKKPLEISRGFFHLSTWKGTFIELFWGRYEKLLHLSFIHRQVLKAHSRDFKKADDKRD